MNPANLPQWAAGLSRSIQLVGDEWLADSPAGPVEVKFASRNNFGIVDHWVTLPTGETMHNPLRAMANGTGCELIFTLFHHPNMANEQFE
ncbi:MAG TPA: hypothetical protein VKA27_02010 [Sunxiuqinia sp.]|nr:hypothetical protein [Sunxiuqinia sp.]